MAIQDDLLRLLRTHPTFRDAARRELFGDEFLSVPARLEAIAAAQQRTAEWMERVVAAQARTDEHLASLTARVDALTVRVDALVEQVSSLTARVDRLVTSHEVVLHRLDRLDEWQRGEQGRREGERDERDTVRRAAAIFGGGRSVTQRPEDLDRLEKALEPVFRGSVELEDADNPLLADILWHKGERIAVAEVSRQVDLSAIDRAVRRAATLQSVGLPAFAIVIGRDWASEEAERAAHARAVEWRVGDDVSTGYRELRRAPAA